MARELSLLLDDGTVIRDSGWTCVGDILSAFHGFGVNRVYGTVVDAETLEPMYPAQQLDQAATTED